MVAKKSDWLAAYKRSIGDEWTAFLETLYTRCKLAWGYRIPDNRSDHQVLRNLCQQVLMFENHYLALYREYLLDQLRGNNRDEQLFAAERLKSIIYPDSEIDSTLRALELSDEETRMVVHETLQIYTTAQRQSI